MLKEQFAYTKEVDKIKSIQFDGERCEAALNLWDNHGGSCSSIYGFLNLFILRDELSYEILA